METDAVGVVSRQPDTNVLVALALLVAPAADDESSLFEHATAGTLHPFGYDAGLISSDLPDELAHHLDTKMLEAPVFGSRSISTSLTLM